MRGGTASTCSEILIISLPPPENVVDLSSFRVPGVLGNHDIVTDCDTGIAIRKDPDFKKGGRHVLGTRALLEQYDSCGVPCAT